MNLKNFLAHRFQYDGDTLDEMVVNNVKSFHIERMNDGHYWLKLTIEDAPDIVINITSDKPILCRHDEEDEA